MRIAREGGAPIWFGYSGSDAIPDKEAVLLQAQAEANHGYWKRSLQLYSEALASSNPGIHAAAEGGYLQARENLHHEHLLNRTYWLISMIVVLLIALPVIHWRAKDNRRKGRFVIEMSSKSGSDVPAELFAASLITAAQEIQDLYRMERQRSNLALGQSDGGFSFSLLTGAGNALNQIADALPEVHGVKVGKILSVVPTLFRFLVIWRLEYGIAIHEDGSGWAHATLRWRRRSVQTWVETLKVSAEDSLGESPQSAAVRELAWRMASDILSKDLVNRTA